MNKKIIQSGKYLFLILILYFLSGCAAKKENVKINYRELDKQALEIMKIAQDHHSKKNYWRARRNYNKVINEYPKSNYADDAQFYIARTFHEKESYSQAVGEYKKLVEDFPASDKIPQTAQYLYEIGEIYWQRNEKYDAVDVFKKTIEIYPFGNFAPDVQFRIANYYFEEKEYNEAIIHFDKLIKLFPDNSMLELSEFKLGLSYFNASLDWALDQDFTNKAILQLTKFIKTYPSNSYAYEGKKIIATCKERLAKRLYKTGEFYLNYDESKSAGIYYKNVIEEYPETIWASYAQFGIGESLKKQKEWTNAVLAYRKLIQDYPESELVDKALKRIDDVNIEIAKAK